MDPELERVSHKRNPIAHESIHTIRAKHTPTPLRTVRVGSTKHRTVAMFCHAIASGDITETTQVITATAAAQCRRVHMNVHKGRSI